VLEVVQAKPVDAVQREQRCARGVPLQADLVRPDQVGLRAVQLGSSSIRPSSTSMPASAASRLSALVPM